MTRTTALTRYSNWCFDRGIIEIAGKRIGLNCNGLSELSGDTDNGEIIESVIKTGSIKATSSEFRVRSFFLFGEFDNSESIELKYGFAREIDEDDMEISPQTQVDGDGMLKFQGIRSLVGEYVNVLIKNLRGANFYIESLDALLIKKRKK